jgi:hypothetical protein
MPIHGPMGGMELDDASHDSHESIEFESSILDSPS